MHPPLIASGIIAAQLPGVLEALEQQALTTSSVQYEILVDNDEIAASKYKDVLHITPCVVVCLSPSANAVIRTHWDSTLQHAGTRLISLEQNAERLADKRPASDDEDEEMPIMRKKKARTDESVPNDATRDSTTQQKRLYPMFMRNATAKPCKAVTKATRHTSTTKRKAPAATASFRGIDMDQWEKELEDLTDQANWGEKFNKKKDDSNKGDSDDNNDNDNDNGNDENNNKNANNDNDNDANNDKGKNANDSDNDESGNDNDNDDNDTDGHVRRGEGTKKSCNRDSKEKSGLLSDGVWYFQRPFRVGHDSETWCAVHPNDANIELAKPEKRVLRGTPPMPTMSTVTSLITDNEAKEDTVRIYASLLAISNGQCQDYPPMPSSWQLSPRFALLINQESKNVPIPWGHGIDPVRGQYIVDRACYRMQTAPIPIAAMCDRLVVGHLVDRNGNAPMSNGVRIKGLGFLHANNAHLIAAKPRKVSWVIKVLGRVPALLQTAEEKGHLQRYRNQDLFQVIASVFTARMRVVITPAQTKRLIQRIRDEKLTDKDTIAELQKVVSMRTTVTGDQMPTYNILKRHLLVEDTLPIPIANPLDKEYMRNFFSHVTRWTDEKELSERATRWSWRASDEKKSKSLGEQASNAESDNERHAGIADKSNGVNESGDKEKKNEQRTRRKRAEERLATLMSMSRPISDNVQERQILLKCAKDYRNRLEAHLVEDCITKSWGGVPCKLEKFEITVDKMCKIIFVDEIQRDAALLMINEWTSMLDGKQFILEASGIMKLPKALRTVTFMDTHAMKDVSPDKVGLSLDKLGYTSVKVEKEQLYEAAPPYFNIEVRDMAVLMRILQETECAGVQTRIVPQWIRMLPWCSECNRGGHWRCTEKREEACTACPKLTEKLQAHATFHDKEQMLEAWKNGAAVGCAARRAYMRIYASFWGVMLKRSLDIGLLSMQPSAQRWRIKHFNILLMQSFGVREPIPEINNEVNTCEKA